MLKRIEWKTVASAAAALLLIAVVAAFGPQIGIPAKMAEGALAFLGAVGTLALGAMRAYMRDSDGDGVPDRLEDGQ